jgi:hypothetical protein
MTVNSYEKLLQRILLGYRQGREQNILPFIEKSNELSVSFGKLSANEQVLISRFENARIRGLIAARKKDLLVSEKYMVHAGMLLNTNLLSQEGRLLYQSSLEQGIAFLDCRRGNFEQARQRTITSLLIDQELEDSYGYNHLIMHRVQQAHNLARIDAYDHQAKRAMGLILEILSYLDGKIDSLSLPSIWGYNRIRCQSPSAMARMFVQVSSEIALIMAGVDNQNAKELFTNNFEELISSSSQQCSCSHVYDWLFIKQAYSQGDFDVFLNRSADFISQRYIEMSLLLQSTLIDIINVCNQLGTLTANQLKWEIINDVVRNPTSVHPRFLPFFQFA